DASQGPHSSMAARPLTSLGDAELALKHPAAATAAYQRALDVLGDSAGGRDSQRAELEAALSRLRAARK
ncbi:MAG TPA: hypothetical protein VK698_18585, partial [Kofleriaceae bacterium]|nr:hypothetical protein [Kofleriaceae bacterium]